VRVIRWSVIAALLATALLALPSASQAAFPGALGGQIAFNANRGTSEEIYVMSSAGFGQTALTANTAVDKEPAWPPAGDRIAFTSNRDGNYEIYVMQPDGSGQTRLTTNAADDLGPAWSADGSKIAFTRYDGVSNTIYVMDADGSDQAPLITQAGEPAWSPDGSKIAFTRNESIWIANADGTNQVELTPPDSPNFVGANMNPNWAPSGGLIAFAHDGCERNCGDGLFPQWEIWTVAPDGSNLGFLPGGGGALEPAWGPPGDRLALTMGGCPYPVGSGPCDPLDIGVLFLSSGTKDNFTDDQLGRNADWQPIPFTGYPRPKSTGPLLVSLVPAYAQCTAPDRTHGAPLAFPSCNPPAQTSSYLTVGTPDANGAPANSAGYARLKVNLGVPGPPHDTQAFLKLSLTDVRCATPAPACGSVNAQGGADYAGELESRIGLRITDRWSAVSPGGGTDPATMEDYTLKLPMFSPCAGTASTAAGANCTTTTNLAAVIPGVVPEGKRAIWEVERVRVYDGGPDGDAATDDNTLFATQGVFVP
jgi:WD40 repeat protein